MKPEELRQVVEQILPLASQPPWYVYLLLLLLAALAAGLGAYFGPYLRAKGKNLATKEDLDKVLQQVDQTTKVTEEIRAQISSELWVKQRRRERQLEAMERLISLCARFLILDQRRPYQKPTHFVVPEHDAEYQNRLKIYREKVDEFLVEWTAAREMARVIFSERAADMVMAIDRFIGPGMTERTIRVQEFIEALHRAMKALLEEACA